MASVYPRGKIHWARINLSNGEWACRSTEVKIKGDKERKQAQKVADELQAFELGLQDSAPSEAFFAKFARDAAKRTHPEQFKDTSVREFFMAWMDENQESVSLDDMGSTTLQYYEGIVSAFLVWLGDAANRSFRSLSTERFIAYRDFLIFSKKGDSTVRKHLRCLSIPLHTAWTKGDLEANPLKAVKLPSGAPNKRNAFTDTEICTLSKTLTGEWLTVFLIGLYTGARLGDCARMRWECVDIFKGTLEFIQRKTKRKRPAELVIPLHSVLWEHLKGIHKTTGLISPGLAQQVGASDDEDGDKASSPLSIEFGELMEAAGISKCSVIQKNGRKFSSKSFHSLRHTINTALNRQAKVGVEVRSRLTGHKLKGMNQHYTHTEIEEVREALALVSFGV